VPNSAIAASSAASRVGFNNIAQTVDVFIQPAAARSKFANLLCCTSSFFQCGNVIARKCSFGIHRGNCSNLFRHCAKFVTQLRGVGFQCCNNARVHQLSAVALGRAMTLGKHGKQAARTSAQLLDANQLVVYTAVAART
jgi:hypothetical protein